MLRLSSLVSCSQAVIPISSFGRRFITKLYLRLVHLDNEVNHKMIELGFL